jgi:serine/threonine protein phosphatase PrpC
MSESRTTQGVIEAAVVTDRGLNERRPLNEDSYLSDPQHGIFAVADGVGGAEAGEVASQTAIEVLEEAFRNQREGDDVEDLLEIAIQRSNASIFRMSREHPKLAMMATTVVALHVEGLRATVGHVGDSRLYRLAPDGQISRETEDHSVVEEEVRAGRMTPEQAQNHPSRNVISRAIGAEQDVEVDLKIIDFEPGTTFVLCTDGITRHVPDAEIASVVAGSADLRAACDTLKRLCFERGAEDNLTAVLVRVGGAPARAAAADSDSEVTLISERTGRDVSSQSVADAFTSFESGRDFSPPAAHASPNGQTDEHVRQDAAPAPPAPRVEPASAEPARKSGGGFGRFLRFMLFMLVVSIFSAAAFYGGMLFEQRRAGEEEAARTAVPPPGPAAPSDGALALGSFELERNRVDGAPVTEVERMERELGADPSNGDDPRFLYLYGRALLLANRPQDALTNLEKAVAKIQETPTSANARLIIDARLATAAASLRSNDAVRARAAVDALGQTFDAGATPQATVQQQAAPFPAPTQ